MIGPKSHGESEAEGTQKEVSEKVSRGAKGDVTHRETRESTGQIVQGPDVHDGEVELGPREQWGTIRRF